MPVWLTWMLGLVLVCGESGVLGAAGIESFAFQSGLIMAIVVGLRRDFIPGALTLAGLLPVIEWCVGGPKGYYGLGLAVVFLLLQLVRGRLHREWGMTHLVAALMACFIHPILMAVGMALSGSAGPVVWGIVWTIPTGAPFALVGLWPVAWLVERGDAFFEGSLRKPRIN